MRPELNAWRLFFRLADFLKNLAAFNTYMSLNQNYREILSALKDGELQASDMELALAMLGDKEGRATFSAYERIGAALRETPSPELSDDFSTRLRARLALELPHPRTGSDSAESAPPLLSPMASGPVPRKA